MGLGLQDDIGLLSNTQRKPDNAFDPIFDRMLKFEGGVNEKEVGQGGVSNFGITQGTFNAYRRSRNEPQEDVRTITKDEVKNISKKEYFDRPKFNRLPERVGGVMFDFGINAGTFSSIKILQGIVGSKPDGFIGPQTIKAVNDFIDKNGEDTLLNKIIDKRREHNNKLIERDPAKYKKFEKGWNNRIETLKKEFNLSLLNPFSVNEAEAAVGDNFPKLDLEDDIGLFGSTAPAKTELPKLGLEDDLGLFPQAKKRDDWTKDFVEYTFAQPWHSFNSQVQAGFARSLKPMADAYDAYADKVGMGDPNAMRGLQKAAIDYQRIAEDEAAKGIIPVDAVSKMTKALYEGLGGAFIQIPKYALASARLGFLAMGAVDFIEATPKGLKEASKAGAQGLAFQQYVKAISILPRKIQLPTAFGTFAGTAKMTGASWEDSIASGVLGVGLSLTGRAPSMEAFRSRWSSSERFKPVLEASQDLNQQKASPTYLQFKSEATEILNKYKDQKVLKDEVREVLLQNREPTVKDAQGNIAITVTDFEVNKVANEIKNLWAKQVSDANAGKLGGITLLTPRELMNRGSQLADKLGFESSMAKEVRSKLNVPQKGISVENKAIVEAAVKAGTIPEFKNTNEAIDYGEAIRGDVEAIGRLKTRMEEQIKKTEKLFEKEDQTDAELQTGLDEAVKSQFMREAYEISTRTGITRTVEKFRQKGIPEADKQDISSLLDWEGSQPGGARTSYINDQGERVFTGNPSAHSKAMQEIGPKESFRLLEKAAAGEDLTEKQAENVQLLLKDFRANIKTSLEATQKEIDNAGQQIPEARREELRQAVEKEEEVEYDWDGEPIKKEPAVTPPASLSALKSQVSGLDTNNLEDLIEKRYEAGASQEELDFLENIYSDRVSEENPNITEDEPAISETAGDEGTDMIPGLIQYYLEYLKSPSERTGAGHGVVTDKEVIGFMRGTLELSGRGMKEEVRDEEILAAAKELYEWKAALVERQKSKKKEFSSVPMIKDKSKITPSGQVRLELQPPQQKELFQEKGELFEGTKQPIPMDEEEYLAKQGYGFMGYSEPALHRQPGATEKEIARQAERIRAEGEVFDKKREELRREYQEKVKSGEFRPLTREEEIIRTAQGNPDNSATQAARRLANKYNIDWKAGQSDVKEPSAFYEPAGRSPAFFSKLSRIIEEKIPNNVSADQALRTIQNSGIKQEEIEFSGIKDFLAGKEKVTKEELRDFIEENTVKVETVVKANTETNQIISKLQRDLNAVSPSYDYVKSQLGGAEPYPSGQPVTWMYKNNRGVSTNVPEYLHGAIDKYTEAKMRLEDYEHSLGDEYFTPAETKFSQYVLPGGENYREVLVTLPGASTPSREKFDVKQISPDEFIVTKATGEGQPDQEVGPIHDKAWKAQQYIAELTKQTGVMFRSAHFDEPNILVHLRTTDRTTADGKKILFIEEIQSDWHAKGKKVGYASPKGEIDKELEDFVRLDATAGAPDELLDKLQDRYGLTDDDGNLGEQLLNIFRQQKQGVPNAPFKNTWHELALKQAIDMAVKEGYDGIAFISGQQTADRYDLSKHVDRIDYAKSGDKYDIFAIRGDDTVISKLAQSQSELEELVGKDVAKKIIENQGKDADFSTKPEMTGKKGKSLSGVDLKVGGEWAKKFYDEILPSAAQKYIKKWGGVIQDFKIKTAIGKQPVKYSPNQEVINALKRNDDLGFDTRKEALEAILSHLDWAQRWDVKGSDALIIEGWREDQVGAIENPKQKGFLITPAMRQEVSTVGQSLFEKPGDYGIVKPSEGLQDEKQISGAKQELSAAEGNINVQTAKKSLPLREAPIAVSFKKDGYVAFPKTKVTTPADVAFAFKFLKTQSLENFYLVAVRQNNAVSVEHVAIGTYNTVPVFPYEFINHLRAAGADGYYLVHNHPSGNTKASREDIEFTRRAERSLRESGFNMLGHVIINDTKYGLMTTSGGQVFDTEETHQEYAQTRKVSVLKKHFEWKVSKEAIGPKIKAPRDVFELIKGFQLDEGTAAAVLLDTQNKIMNIFPLPNSAVTVGNIQNMVVEARAASVILVNSGLKLVSTKEFRYALKEINISLLDDIRVTFDNTGDVEEFYSQADANLMEESGKYNAPAVTKTSVSEPASFKPVPAAKTPQDLLKRIEQLNKFGAARAILRRTGYLRAAAGRFQPIPKEGVVKIDEETILSPQEYLTVMGHELGHAIEFNVTGRVGMGTSGAKKGFALFGEDADHKKIRAELIAVSEDLVGLETMATKPKYYYQSTELIARFFEKIIASPGNLEDLAPYTLEKLEEQTVKHPIIQEFLEAASGIDKGEPKIVPMRDLRQTYQKYLGKRVGDLAYGEEIAYRAMKERGKLAIEGLIKAKFKGVNDSPENLFMAAESIKISRVGIPEFGTRKYITARTQEEETALINSGYEKTPQPVVEDGEAFPQYAQWIYTPEVASKLFEALSPAGKKLVLDFTAERTEAKDYFNREVIREVNNIHGNIEGWVFHYFEDRPGSPIQGGAKFKTRLAGTRRQRKGVEGYTKDFQKAMTKVLIDLEGEKVYNDFIKRQFARVTRPIAARADPLPGWVEVQGTLKSGVGLPQEKKMVIIDKATGEKIPIRQSRYQMPKAIYERYKLWRGLIDEATTAVRIVNDLNRYWRVNILAHPGTAMTNMFSGGIQYSAKILTDFYTEVLTGSVSMPKTRLNVSSMVKTLLPKGWMAAPDWVYGGDLSNFYGQFMKVKSPVSAGIDTYGNAALKFFGAIERYWKKTIMLSNNVADLESLGKMTTEGLRLPTEEERNLIAAINNEVDLYGYDYDNVPVWLEAHQKSALGQSIKPFAKYPYKYAKQVLDMVGSAFDGTLPWQERVAKIMALATMVAAYAAFSQSRKKKQKTPVAELDIEIPARLQTRGRLFVHTDEKGREMFARVAKYPFINLTEAGMQVVDGNFEGAKDGVADMIGSIGPAAQIGLLAFNYRNKFQTYDTVPVIIGDSLVTFTPGYRILNDVSQLLDPFKRKQEGFAQAFTRIIPTTSPALQEKLHGKIRMERVPEEGSITGALGKRTTVDYALENYWQDTLLSLLSGIYVNRVDPKIAEAYIIRKKKNLEKKKQDE